MTKPLGWFDSLSAAEKFASLVAASPGIEECCASMEVVSWEGFMHTLPVVLYRRKGEMGMGHCYGQKDWNYQNGGTF